MKGGRKEKKEGRKAYLFGHLQAINILASTARDEVAHPLPFRRVEQVLKVVVVAAQVGVHLPRREGARGRGREGRVSGSPSGTCEEKRKEGGKN